MSGGFENFIGKRVVIDTDSDLIYLGRVTGANDCFLTLENADVHHTDESASTRDAYVADSKKFGIRENRRLVKLLKSRVVSISLLEDVIEY